MHRALSPPVTGVSVWHYCCFSLGITKKLLQLMYKGKIEAFWILGLFFQSGWGGWFVATVHMALINEIWVDFGIASCLKKKKKSGYNRFAMCLSLLHMKYYTYSWSFYFEYGHFCNNFIRCIGYSSNFWKFLMFCIIKSVSHTWHRLQIWP